MNKPNRDPYALHRKHEPDANTVQCIAARKVLARVHATKEARRKKNSLRGRIMSLFRMARK